MIFEWVHSVSIGIDIAPIAIWFEVEKAAPEFVVAVISCSKHGSTSDLPENSKNK